MTLPITHIKPNAWAPPFAGALRHLALSLAAAAARRRARADEVTAFRRWMKHERARADMDGVSFDDEESALCDVGFASTLFQNRVGSSDQISRRRRT